MSEPASAPAGVPAIPPAPAIEVRDLVRRYGHVDAVRGVSFSVPAGQVCGFLGPNGAGKSTTIKVLAGVLAATSGVVRVAGHDVSADSLEARRRTGYVPDGGALYGLLSAREHLALLSDLHELEPAWAAERVARLLAAFELEAVADRRVESLSKGQRRKVALAAGLLHDPQVLLLDEPLDGLDANAARALKGLIADLAARGRTVLYCSHILDVVERLCERVIIIAAGRVVADGPTKELVARGGGAGTAGEGKTLEALFHELTVGAGEAQRDALAGLA